jgi:hypothetical protein
MVIGQVEKRTALYVILMQHGEIMTTLGRYHAQDFAMIIPSCTLQSNILQPI